MSTETTWDVIVIGGGPAGMMAAGRAAERGKRVLLLEKNPGLGTKLLITGGGRCNVTNNKSDVRVMLARYKESGKFLASPFTRFGVAETIRFFSERGMAMKEENDGRLFPKSEKAQSVLDVLVAYLKEGGVTVRTGAVVAGVEYDARSKEFTVRLKDGTEARGDACVVATGGLSHPETGSTGEGFRWLAKLGHTIVENDMALVPVALKDVWVRAAAGVTLQDIKLTVFQGATKKLVQKGKLLFTHVGISGPTVLNMSKEIGALLRDVEAEDYASPGGGEVTIMFDLYPTTDLGALREKLQDILVALSNRKIRNVLSALVPPALVGPILELAGVDGETPCHSVRTEERKALVVLLKAIPLHVAGLLGKDKAIVSSGGVALTEVDWKSCQSLKVPGLFLAGDVLDIDRPSGGYSLQLCWTTGYIAGSQC